MARHHALLGSIPPRISVRPDAVVRTDKVETSTIYRWRKHGLIQWHPRHEGYVLSRKGAEALGYRPRFPRFIERLIDLINRPMPL